MAVLDILDSVAMERLRRPTGLAFGLPRQAYFDPEFHAAELRHVFARNWVFIGVTDRFAEPNSFHPVQVADLPLVVTCNNAGELKAFHNVCGHRGALLADAPCRHTKILRCPYHSWAYDLNGQLRQTPHFGGHHKHTHDDFDRSANPLRQVRLECWHKLVFVNLSESGPSLAEYLAPLTERWGAYDWSLLRYGGGVEFDFAANWKLAVENYSESYHLPWVHPGLNSYSRLEDHYNLKIPGLGSGQGSLAYKPAPVTDVPLPRFPDLPEELRTRAEYVTIFPNLMVGVHPDLFFALVAQPTSATHCHEELHAFFVGEEAMSEAQAPNRDDAIGRWKEINEEDIAVVLRMQAGRRSPAMEGGRFSPELDNSVHDFQLQIADAILAGERPGASLSVAA